MYFDPGSPLTLTTLSKHDEFHRWNENCTSIDFHKNMFFGVNCIKLIQFPV